MPLLLIHPKTGDTYMAHKGEGAVVRSLILDGYEPIGPKGQAAAAVIREQDDRLRLDHLERPDRYDDRGDNDQD